MKPGVRFVAALRWQSIHKEEGALLQLRLHAFFGRANIEVKGRRRRLL